MTTESLTALLGTAVAVIAIGSATVAVSLGKIEGEAYVAIMTTFGGFAAGAGAHAAGRKSGRS